MSKYALIFFISIMLLVLPSCSTQSEATQTLPEQTETPLVPNQDLTKDLNVAVLKGPTGIGMLRLMEQNDNGASINKYNFSIMGTADEIVSKITSGELDIAAVPCNLAAVLYNKTNGGIRVAAVNNLGVLYLLEDGEEIKSIQDLKSKTIYNTGKNTTPEYSLNYLLDKNGLNDKDVTVEYKTEASELAALMASKQIKLAVLPEPHATNVMEKNPNIRVALDLTKEWNKVSDGKSSLVTGVIVARSEIIDNYSTIFSTFLKEYRSSVYFAKDTYKITDISKLCEKYNIVTAAVAEKAIPRCNLTYLEGEAMKTAVSGYLKVLFDANPASTGGSLPDEKFYVK